MKGTSIFCGISAILFIVFAVWVGILYNSPKPTEVQKNELINMARDIAKEYQKKKIENEGFSIQETNRSIVLSKENKGYVFYVYFDDSEMSKHAQIKFPANIDDGILKIGVEYPSYSDDSLGMGLFLLIEFLLLMISIILVVASVTAWRKS